MLGLGDPELVSLALPGDATRRDDGRLLVRPLRANVFPTRVQRAAFLPSHSDGELLGGFAGCRGQLFARLGSAQGTLALVTSRPGAGAVHGMPDGMVKYLVSIYADSVQIPRESQLWTQFVKTTASTHVATLAGVGGCFVINDELARTAESLSGLCAFAACQRDLTQTFHTVAKFNLASEPLWSVKTGEHPERQIHVPQVGGAFASRDFSGVGHAAEDDAVATVPHWTFVYNLVSNKHPSLQRLVMGESLPPVADLRCIHACRPLLICASLAADLRVSRC
jgi:hypothetical protein